MITEKTTDRYGVGFLGPVDDVFPVLPSSAIRAAASCPRHGREMVRFHRRPRPQGYAKKKSPSGYWGGKKLH
nr:MAG TPA: hypothetical protein [Caudoviricetes sp.]